MAIKSPIEKVSDLVFIVTCVILASVTVYKALPARPAGGATVDVARVGSEVKVPGADFSNADRTVLIAISSTCTFCTQSMPFYRRLTALRKPVVFVGYETTPVLTEYLETNGVTSPTILPLSPSLNIRGTPTLMIVDASAKVMASWGGLMTPDQQADALREIDQTGR